MAGRPVLSRADKYRIAVSGENCFCRVLQHDCRRAATNRDGGTVSRLYAQILGDHGSKHEIRLGHRIGGEESVDIFQREPRVVECPFACLRVEADARHVWNFADIGFSDPGDDDLITK